MTTAENAPSVEISAGEIQRRVAVLRRFRELLSQQRDRFARYLEVLDKQKDLIESGSASDLAVHVELEEQILADIFAIQKVIDPLEVMYRALSPAAVSAVLPEEQELPGLKASLENLKLEAAVRAERNKNLLSRRMDELRQEVKNLRGNPYAARRSVYSGESPSLVDISG
jgi:hypothetical protein